MRFLRSPRLEKALLGLLLAVFVIPLPLTAVVYLKPGRPEVFTGWRALILGNNPFELPPLPAFSFDTVRTGRYQEALAIHFNKDYAGRVWVIRCAQEMYLRLFHHVSGPALLGRNNSTYYNDLPYQFIDEYCVERPGPDALRPIVDGLRLWRDACQSRGVGLVIAITPSKASVYPEDLPPAWRRRYDPRPRGYDHFVRLLREQGIRYVDGFLLTMDAKARDPAPTFPLGGTHWDQYAALQTANAVLEDLAAQGQPVRPIDRVETTLAYHPYGEDADMMGVIQPLIRWRYPVSRVNYPPVASPEGTRPSLVLVGGSFVGTLGRHLFRSEQFSEIHWLRYYGMSLEIPEPLPGRGWQTDRRPRAAAELRRELLTAQCVVLEINEQQLTTPLHLRQLFDDTLTLLPGAGAPAETFPFHENFQPCRWGETIRFTNEGGQFKPGVYSGVSGPEPAGAWTDGPESTLRLTVPDVTQDALLSVEAAAAMVPGRLTIQRVQVSANGRPLGEWVYEDGEPHRHEAFIPRALLGDGRLTLQFRYSQTISPNEVSGAGDFRQLALRLGALTLRQPDRRVDGPVYSAAADARQDAVYAVNFAGAEANGRWTDGPSATIRLPAPAGTDQDAVFSAEFDPLILPGTLPEQRARVLVNGQPVGEWIIGVSGHQRREVIVPRALLNTGKLEVEFRFSDTAQLTEPGSGGDARRLALFFTSVQLHWFVPVGGERK